MIKFLIIFLCAFAGPDDEPNPFQILNIPMSGATDSQVEARFKELEKTFPNLNARQRGEIKNAYQQLKTESDRAYSAKRIQTKREQDEIDRNDYSPSHLEKLGKSLLRKYKITGFMPNLNETIENMIVDQRIAESKRQVEWASKGYVRASPNYQGMKLVLQRFHKEYVGGLPNYFALDQYISSLAGEMSFTHNGDRINVKVGSYGESPENIKALDGLFKYGRDRASLTKEEFMKLYETWYKMVDSKLDIAQNRIWMERFRGLFSASAADLLKARIVGGLDQNAKMLRDYLDILAPRERLELLSEFMVRESSKGRLTEKKIREKIGYEVEYIFRTEPGTREAIADNAKWRWFAPKDPLLLCIYTIEKMAKDMK